MPRVHHLLLIAALIHVLPARCADSGRPSLDAGYRQMYNLQFDQAHQTFAQWKSAHPFDPLGPVSDAAAYLFSEFDRLHILQGEFFLRDDNFRKSGKLTPDPAARKAFDQELAVAGEQAAHALARSATDANALFAAILANGLRADYDALIEKRYLSSFNSMKTSRLTAEKLLSLDPTYYDAYLAVGVENYMLSLKPAPVRWLLRMGGGATDREEGLKQLRLTAEKGRYLGPFARLLLAVAALRDKNIPQAKQFLLDLSREFPGNRLYREELGRLK